MGAGLTSSRSGRTALAGAWDGAGSRDVLVFADPTPPREDLVLLVRNLLSEEQQPEGEPEEVREMSGDIPLELTEICHQF